MIVTAYASLVYPEKFTFGRNHSKHELINLLNLWEDLVGESHPVDAFLGDIDDEPSRDPASF